MRHAFIGAALVALGACGLSACGQGQPAKETAEAPAAAAPEATNLKDKAGTLGPAELALFAAEQVKTAPGGPRACDRLYNTENMGEIPADALTGSVFAAHVGARVFAIHCQATGEPMATDGRGQWLVFMPANSMSATIEPCQPSPTAVNVCFKPVPRNPA